MKKEPNNISSETIALMSKIEKLTGENKMLKQENEYLKKLVDKMAVSRKSSHPIPYA